MGRRSRPGTCRLQRPIGPTVSFVPRMAVYNDVEGWQNSQFWGRDEFALPFGNFDVNITVPADHILDGTGVLVNRKEVFTQTMMKRFEKAKKSYKKVSDKYS